MNENTVKWPDILGSEQRAELAALLLAYAREKRWYRAKAREPRSAEVTSVIPLGEDKVLAVLRIAYAGGDSDLYAIPLARVRGGDGRGTDADPVESPPPGDVVARLGLDGDEGALVDGLTRPGLAAEALLRVVIEARALGDDMGASVRGDVVSSMDAWRASPLPAATPGAVEQTNSTLRFGARALLKVYRQLSAGTNPELEMGRYLTSQADVTFTPRVLGALTYEAADGATYNLGVVHEFVANEGDALALALAELRSYFARLAGQPSHAAPRAPVGTEATLSRALGSSTPAASEGGGGFGAVAATLGRRTGQLHLALARAGPEQPDFVAQPMDADERRHLVARAEAMLAAQLNALSNARQHLSAAAVALADVLLHPQARQNISEKLARFAEADLLITKTRTHGDLHLGQVLAHEGDFVLIDFEGEPSRPLEQRRAKSSPLRDVMGMVRSLAYAPEILLRDPAFLAEARASRHLLEPWAAHWSAEVTVAYLRGYLATVSQAAFVPRVPRDLLTVLTFYELEKVIYEVAYELNHRPDWVEIPLRGLVALARAGDQGTGAPDDHPSDAAAPEATTT